MQQHEPILNTDPIIASLLVPNFFCLMYQTFLSHDEWTVKVHFVGIVEFIFNKSGQDITRVNADCCLLHSAASVSLLAQLAVQLAGLPDGSIGVYMAGPGALESPGDRQLLNHFNQHLYPIYWWILDNDATCYYF